jgi:hypothetical protein
MSLSSFTSHSLILLYDRLMCPVMRTDIEIDKNFTYLCALKRLDAGWMTEGSEFEFR